MRFPVYSRRSNPSIDKPIIRKHMKYLEAQVSDFLADWVDPSDKRKGIIAREFLRSGRALPPNPVDVEKLLTMPPVELPGLHLEFAKNCEGVSMASVRANWNWTPPETLGASAG